MYDQTLFIAFGWQLAARAGLMRAMALKVYQYAKCSTCRKAIKWLEAHEVKHALVPILEQPPSPAELKRALKTGVPLRGLFNTSGESYRNGNFKARLPGMSEAEALAALVADGKLIKRPFAIAGDTVLVGFDEAAWARALG
jgi:arsenate reductase